MKSVFAICAVENPEAVALAIGKRFPLHHVQLAPGQWLIAAVGVTAKDISDALGISDRTTSLAIVVGVSSYFGRQPKRIWEWIEENLDSGSTPKCDCR